MISNAASQIIAYMLTPNDVIVSDATVLADFDQNTSFKYHFNKYHPGAFPQFSDSHSYFLRRTYWRKSPDQPVFAEKIFRACLADLGSFTFHEFFSKYCVSHYADEAQVPDVLLAQFRFAMHSQLKGRREEIDWLKQQECSSMYPYAKKDRLSRRAYLQDKKSKAVYLYQNELSSYLAFLDQLRPKNIPFRAQIMVDHGHQTTIDLCIDEQGKQAIILDAAETISADSYQLKPFTDLGYQLRILQADLSQKTKIQNDQSCCVYYSVEMALAAERTENLHEIARNQEGLKLPLSALPPRFVKNGQSVSFLTLHPGAKNYKEGEDLLAHAQKKGRISDGINIGINKRIREITLYETKFGYCENLDEFAALVERTSRSPFDLLEDEFNRIQA